MQNSVVKERWTANLSNIIHQLYRRVQQLTVWLFSVLWLGLALNEWIRVKAILVQIAEQE